MSHCIRARVKHQCPICGALFDVFHLTKHIKYHQKDTICPTCGNVVPGRKKFCNQVCAAKFNNKHRPRKLKGRCKNCGAELDRSNKKYCNLNCKNNFEYNEYIKRWLKGKVDGNRGNYGQISAYVRRWMLECCQEKCEKCGWGKRNPFTDRIPLNVHHKDGDSENTVPENLELLCPNCHSLTETYGSRNRGSGRKNRYASIA